MKFAKILISIIIVNTVLGCGIIKPPTATPAKTQAQTPNKTQSNQSQTSAAAVVSNPSPLSSVSLKWLGADKDFLSPNDLNPDGKPDGHFHLTVSFNQPSAVKSIWIRNSEFGKSFKWGWIYNKNLPLVGYLMAVFDGKGKQILPQSDNGFNVNGLTDFDLYISELDNVNDRDNLKFADNQTYNLEIDYVTQNNEEKKINYSLKI